MNYLTNNCSASQWYTNNWLARKLFVYKCCSSQWYAYNKLFRHLLLYTELMKWILTKTQRHGHQGLTPLILPFWFGMMGNGTWVFYTRQNFTSNMNCHEIQSKLLLLRKSNLHKLGKWKEHWFLNNKFTNGTDAPFVNLLFRAFHYLGLFTTPLEFDHYAVRGTSPVWRTISDSSADARLCVVSRHWAWLW